ncbi:MAG: TIM barrel protein [Armatimonadetes bacterium]|nr:TIM barrel protein [Armatimonadota bacterium]
MNTKFAFSAGVWNLNRGEDPFGPAVRAEIPFATKLTTLKALGLDYVQFHDDDAVPLGVSPIQVAAEAARVRALCEDAGLKVEFVAPRIWEDPRFIDGAITANDPEVRRSALDRGKRAIDVAKVLGTDRIVLWPAREGTYVREAKDAVAAFDQFVEFLNAMLAYDSQIRILGEMKPNEPMDLMYLPSTGHVLAMAYRTADPSRVGALIEAAHSILLGLDPSDEMAFAIWHRKLWGVHLNDQDGLKFDEDKSFGSANLRRAFNVVDVLVRNDYGKQGEVVGLDVKAMRTQPAEIANKHLTNSKRMFERLVHVSATIDRNAWQAFRDARDYEGLDQFILDALMGTR